MKVQTIYVCRNAIRSAQNFESYRNFSDEAQRIGGWRDSVDRVAIAGRGTKKAFTISKI